MTAVSNLSFRSTKLICTLFLFLFLWTTNGKAEEDAPRERADRRGRRTVRGARGGRARRLDGADSAGVGLPAPDARRVRRS